MSDQNSSQNSLPDSSDGDAIRAFLLMHNDDDEYNDDDGSNTQSSSSGSTCILYGYACIQPLLDEVLDKIKKDSELTEAQQEHNLPLTPVVQPAGTQAPATSQPSGQGAPAQPAHAEHRRRNSNNSSDRQALISRLNGKEPVIIKYKGTVLNRNERKKIIAAVAICESGYDTFSSENKDQEFVGRRSGNRGIETGYSRIVHIGLSWGIINFSQDSGALGEVLTRLNKADSQKFAETFGDNWQELLTLTTTGINVPGADYASGQGHWSSLSSGQRHSLQSLANNHRLPANQEIRGKCVQPIAINIGKEKQDLWQGVWAQRFIAAGHIGEFQDAEIDCAVDNYLNKILAFCVENNIRSGKGLAFVTACAIRGGIKSRLVRLLVKAAKQKNILVPFTSPDDEGRALLAISKGEIRGVAGPEKARAKTIYADNSGLLLEEDAYWTGSYNDEYDK